MAFECSRYIFQAGLEIYPTKKKLWFSWINLEEEFGSKEQLSTVLKDAMEKAQQNNVIFVLKYSKHVWKCLGDPQKALEIL